MLGSCVRATLWMVINDEFGAVAATVASLSVVVLGQPCRSVDDICRC